MYLQLCPKIWLFQSSRKEGVFDANFSYFTSKPYAETPHRDGSVEGLQHIFYAELTKIIPNCHQILPLILSPAL